MGLQLGLEVLGDGLAACLGGRSVIVQKLLEGVEKRRASGIRPAHDLMRQLQAQLDKGRMNLRVVNGQLLDDGVVAFVLLKVMEELRFGGGSGGGGQIFVAALFGQLESDRRCLELS